MRGSYIRSPGVFEKLRKGSVGAGGEIQLTDAMAETIGSVLLHAVRFEGERFECGDKAGYLAAKLAYGLAREDIGPKLLERMPGNINPLTG